MIFKAFIVGCGNIGGSSDSQRESRGEELCSHASAYNQLESFRLVGCADTDLTKAEALANYVGGVRIYDSTVRGLEDCEPDVVSICTPDHTHYSVLCEILSASSLPKIIFLEKPAFSSEDELAAARSLVEAEGVQVVVNNSRRFHATYQNLKSVISQSRFGPAVRIDCWYYGGWVHNGVHVVDTLTFLFDQRVQCKQIVRARSVDDRDCAIDAIFEVENTDIEIHVNFFEEAMYQIFEFDFKFADARLRIENFEADINFQTVVTNALDERVLQNADASGFFSPNSVAPMMQALTYIEELLRQPCKLNEHCLESACKALECLWDVRRRSSL